MARQYHNLEGWLRDAIAAVDEYERDPGGDGTSAWCRFLDVLHDAGVAFASEMEADEEDDTDDAIDGVAGDMDGSVAEGREADAPQPRRHDARVQVFGPAASRLGRHVGDVPGSLGATAEPEQSNLWGDPVGPPCGLMRTRPAEHIPPSGRMAPQESRGVPRGTPAPEPKARTRKGVSRGKKRTRKTKR